jgi:hypothetical protein
VSIEKRSFRDFRGFERMMPATTGGCVPARRPTLSRAVRRGHSGERPKPRRSWRWQRAGVRRAQGRLARARPLSGVTSAEGKSARRRSDRPRRRFAAAAGITRESNRWLAVARISRRRGRSVRQVPKGRFSTPRSGSRGAASPARGEASCPHPWVEAPDATRRRSPV